MQQVDFENRLNATLDSSADNLDVKDVLQETEKTFTYTPEQEELIRNLAEVLSAHGDRIDPLLRNAPFFRKAAINATFTTLGIGSFKENLKLAGKVLLGGAAAYFVIRTVVNNVAPTVFALAVSAGPQTLQSQDIDYEAMFGDFAPYAKQIYQAFIAYNSENYFSNLAKLSTAAGPLALEKISLADHAWLLGSAIPVFPLSAPYIMEELDYYCQIKALSAVLPQGIVTFYQTLAQKKQIPLSVRCDIGRAALIMASAGG